MIAKPPRQPLELPMMWLGVAKERCTLSETTQFKLASRISPPKLFARYKVVKATEKLNG